MMSADVRLETILFAHYLRCGQRPLAWLVKSYCIPEVSEFLRSQGMGDDEIDVLLDLAQGGKEPTERTINIDALLLAHALRTDSFDVAFARVTDRMIQDAVDLLLAEGLSAGDVDELVRGCGLRD